ncbi:hypothetical protein [Corallococcus coralloides]|uniref:hypothetical protein n=1 Tax=Corallococcus coralloides TaxID=184914 RepID=UPI0011D28130|nr:hypothetical protein [Corallococcus coralloides]
MAYLDDSNRVRILREYSEAGRAKLRKTRDGCWFVYGDNEPASWVFAEIYHGRDLSRMRPEELINRICICHPKGRSEADKNFAYNFVMGAKTWNSTLAYHHKHVFDVKDGAVSRAPEEMSAPLANAQMLRYLCPMNHFLMPERFRNLVERHGDQRFQGVASYFMLLRYGNDYRDFVSRIHAANAAQALRLGEENYESLEMPESTSNSAPPPTTQSDNYPAEMVTRLAPQTGCEFIMTGGGDRRDYSTRKIPLMRLAKPYTLFLSWKDPASAPSTAVGKFSLNLQALLVEGYVRLEGCVPDQVIRMFIRRKEGRYYIQYSRNSPALEISSVP